ncbi:hypothetical protein PAMA_005973 [Pampus argenteus]
MKSSSPLLSPPPSPHHAPLPLPSSSLMRCPELDLSVTLSPPPKTGHTHLKSRPLQPCPQSYPTHLTTCPRGPTGKRNTQVCFEEPLGVTVKLEPHIPLSSDALQQPISSQKRRGGHHGGSPKRSACPPDIVSKENPGCLEEAGLNTTLALKAELQSLQGAEFNSQKAIQDTLRNSERTKNLINTRSTEGVNVSRSQLLFTSLVSISVQQDQLISQALQDRLLLAPPPRSHDSKAAEGPSPLFFMTSDLLRQKPLPLEETVTTKPRPIPCPAHSTFDLYSRRRCWEATP